MKKPLISFFQQYPMEGDVKIALKMIKKKIHCAIEALDKEEEDDEYMKYLSEAHKMMESIFEEMGKAPEPYR